MENKDKIEIPFGAKDSELCECEYTIPEGYEVKEMDLGIEYKNFVEEDPVYNKLVNSIVGKAIAKHFFALGLKAQKGEEV